MIHWNNIIPLPREKILEEILINPRECLYSTNSAHIHPACIPTWVPHPYLHMSKVFHQQLTDKALKTSTNLASHHYTPSEIHFFDCTINNFHFKGKILETLEIFYKLHHLIKLPLLQKIAELSIPKLNLSILINLLKFRKCLNSSNKLKIFLNHTDLEILNHLILTIWNNVQLLHWHHAAYFLCASLQLSPKRVRHFPKEMQSAVILLKQVSTINLPSNI